MHRTIGFISKRLTHVRTGEARKVLLTFLYFFLVITAYYVIKPVSRSLILGDLGSRMVPYVDLLSALLMGPMVALFARLVDRIEKSRLVSLTLWAVAANLVVFWKLLQWPEKWVVAAFYLWVSIFSVLVVTLFWLVANDLYHPREAKRLFGFIGSGGILGGVVGSSIAAAGASLIGTEQLLLCSAAILLACWLVVRQLWRYAPAPAAAAEQDARAHPELPAGGTPMTSARVLFRSRYLILLVGLVGIAKIVSTLIYYQFNPFIEVMFPDQDAKTAFMGLFFGWMNAASFCVQFFFTSWILRHLGLTMALLALPIGVLGGSVGMLLIPAFWIAATTELYDGSLNYSIQQTSKEVLYLPIERSIRYKVKPFIDMVVFRFGKGLAAIIGIVCLDALHLEARVLSYLTVPLVGAWIVLVLELRRDYVRRIRSILQTRATSRRSRDLEFLKRQPAEAPVAHERLDEWQESLAPSPPAQQKLALTSQLFAANGAMVEGGKELLEALAQDEQRRAAAEHLDAAGSLDRLKQCLSDPHEPMAKRRAAVKQFVQRDGQEAVDCLLGMLMVEEETDMRQELIRGLTKLRLRHPHGLEFPKRLIRRQIAKEAQAYHRIIQVAAIYRHLSAAAVVKTDAVLGLLRLITEETTQQIFRLLSLLYRPEDIYLIYNQLRELDTYLRSDAIELLDNLVDPGLRRLIFPVLDEDRFLGRVDGEFDGPAPSSHDAVRGLRQGLWDHNRWLSLAIISLIGRLRVEPLLTELDRAAQSHDPVLSKAAQTARRLAAHPTHA